MINVSHSIRKANFWSAHQRINCTLRRGSLSLGSDPYTPIAVCEKLVGSQADHPQHDAQKRQLCKANILPKWNLKIQWIFGIRVSTPLYQILALTVMEKPVRSSSIWKTQDPCIINLRRRWLVYRCRPIRSSFLIWRASVRRFLAFKMPWISLMP